MISTDLQRVQIQDIIEYQLPAFVRDDFPLVGEFLRQYYISQEYPTAPSDVIQNIDEYLKLETLLDSTESAILESDIEFDATSISARIDISSVERTGRSLNDIQREQTLGTYGFPERYGLIQIDNEIILYTSRTFSSFEGCIRGFSGVTNFTSENDQLTFSSSDSTSHIQGTKIVNLSNLLLKEFLEKLKTQISPGFENRDLDSSINKRLFLSRSKDFYTSKGTDESFKILFSSLYGEKVEVIKPKEFLFRPSDAQYRKTKDIVVESVVGDPTLLENQTLYQDAYPQYGISQSFATIIDVQKLLRSGKEYYQLSVDFDYSKDIDLTGGTQYGDFVAHPKTKNTIVVASGSSIIDVDSTLGFPDKGELYVDGQSGILTYRSKTDNQFTEVGLANTTVFGTNVNISSGTDINLFVNAYGFKGKDVVSVASTNALSVGIATTSKIEVRIRNVLDENYISDDSLYYTDSDKIKVKSLGITTTAFKNISWQTNISPTYQVESVFLLDSSDFTYRLTTVADNNFRMGDKVTIIQSDGVGKQGTVIDIGSSNIVTIQGTGELTGSTFDARRDIIKPKIDTVSLDSYRYVENYTANVQNVYSKFNGDTLVASSSIPSYLNTPLNITDRKLDLNGSYDGETFSFAKNHGYFTGDKINYETNVTEDEFGNLIISKFPEIDSGTYIVKKINDTDFKIATNASNLSNGTFISVSGIVTNNYFCPSEFYKKDLGQQKLYREFKSPVNDGKIYDTVPGKTGMLINGVEILNYKSGDSVYYGRINNIVVSAPGDNYDVINPPILSIQDSVGVGATGLVNVKGNLKRIELLDQGFDYAEDPIVKITGGNGSGARAFANTKFVTHSVSFSSEVDNPQVGLSSDTIGFTTFHKFKESERVIYKTDGQTSIGGLSPDSEYYIKLVDTKTIKLFPTESDTISGSNAINLTSNGNGVHRFVSFDKKRVISDIIVESSGEAYENKKRTTDSAGINTATNQISISNHGFKSGETVTYTGNASGLSSNENYVVTTVDSDNFKLSSVGIGTTSYDFYFETDQYINIESVGSGSHSFNYPDIVVSVVGKIGIKTFSGQDFNAKIQPIFRGTIESVDLSNNGTGYGSSEIINYNKQPVFNLLSGRDAELLPVVNNGKIIEVLVTNGGYEYNTAPDLIVNGAGKYAKITPVISNGQIERVIVENEGIDYTDSTSVSVIASGSGANLNADINRWTVNLFERNKNILKEDDGVLDTSLVEDYGVQYVHLYAPRKLRQTTFGTNLLRLTVNFAGGIPDLTIDDSNKEINNSLHSPIIGWAYDGNPIYGPNGFDTNVGGVVRTLKSGYELQPSSQRPPLSEFRSGFFCEDYVFTGNGDLDEHNGRYCVTPQFPNGVYAYFATIDEGAPQTGTIFDNFKLPIYPYFIGNSFKSKPNAFNFDKKSYQGIYDIQNNGWFRDTTTYGLTNKSISYEFVTQPYEIFEEVIDITSTSTGSIDNVGIVTGGSGYKVGDRVIFEKLDGAVSAKAKVSRVEGKIINSVSVASSVVSELEITPVNSDGKYVAFSTSPHNFTDKNLVTLSGFNTSTNLNNKSFSIGVTTDSYNLSSGVSDSSATGIVTYFSIDGVLNRGSLSIRENDILEIGTENVKVLNVDKLNSRIRVERSVNGTVSAAHTATTTIREKTRKFTFDLSRENNVEFELNKQVYFDPKETLGIGTIAGVGIGSTILFSNPGAGITQTFLNSRSLFLPNHELKTGDVVVYNNGGGTSIEVSSNPSVGTTHVSNLTLLYVAKIDDDVIGIQTFKVGIGSTGTFVGVADTTMNSGLLYFTGIGTGTNHSFKTVRENVVNAEALKNTVTVSTASTHGLSIQDEVKVSVTPGITTTITVKYNDYNRRFVFNPLGFTTAGVSTSQNTITIVDHGFETGDKVILDSNPAPTGLEDQNIYYISRFTKDKIKLCNSKYDAEKLSPNFVSIDIARKGNLLQINPSFDVYEGNTVIFDLSDSSLSDVNGSTRYSAFDLNLYRDSNFTDQFDGTLTSNKFEVVKSGKIGISSDAKLTLSVNNKVPNNLFYKFSNVNSSLISDVKKEFITDDEVLGFNKINKTQSSYTGDFSLTKVQSLSFEYNIEKLAERSSYTLSNASLSYDTNSVHAYGGISDVNITYKGSGYKEIVGVSTIVGIVTGTGAILETSSNSIGNVLRTKIENIGFDYPIDQTLRPTTSLPVVLTLESLTSFEEIGISSGGRNYSIAPNLIVLDGLTGALIDDVDLSYKLGDPKVTIRNNTSGLSNITPSIIPISNSNGVSIDTISFDMTTKDVTVGFNTGFSDQSPFAVGDKVLIENISVGVGSTASGYNSADYGYQLFTLTDVNIPLGGSVGVVTYSLSGILDDNLYAGNYDSINSSGKIINQNAFPQFDIKLKKNDFLLGEKVVTTNDTTSNAEGVVNSWNNRIELLKVSPLSNEFRVGDIVLGQSSTTKGKIKSKIVYNSEIELNSSSTVERGWNKPTGFLNNNLQRIPDNHYYQEFSYAIKSKVPIQKWDDTVSSLNHTAGFLKFSDLVIESSDETNTGGVFTDQESTISITVDILPQPTYGSEFDPITGGISLNCYHDFDLVTENSKTVSGKIFSDRIFFKKRVLTNFFESVGNRALTIDDFSNQFNSEPRPEKFSIVKKFPIEQRSKKIFTFVRDKFFTGERQASLVTIIQDGSNAAVSNYGRVDSVLDLGSFDFRISGTEGELLFFPTKFAINNYNVSYCSFDLDNGQTGIGSFGLGEICDIRSTQVTIPASTKTTIVGIASTYRSSKVLVEFNSNTGIFGFSELNIIHDGTTAQLLEYGDISTEVNSSALGFGTYSVDMSSGTINVDFTPNAGFALTANTVRVSLASTESVGVGTTIIGFAGENISELQSFHTSISSSGTPGIHTIATYTHDGSGETSQNDYIAAYYLVSIEDTTNDEYQLSEIIVLNDNSESYITEYGTLTTGSGIGTIGALRASTETHLQYTPPANANIQTKVFQKAIQIVEIETTEDNEIDLNNASITAGHGFYTGTETDIKRDFALKHEGLEIFRRDFDASESQIVDVSNDTIRLPNHFFNTGEAVKYSVGVSTTQRIGIAETTFAGIGSTSLLPLTADVFIIKQNDSTIKLASSAENALASNPVAIGITALGIGTYHTFTAQDQNTKCLIALDNFIQNPIVSTSVTTSLGKEVKLGETIIETVGVTSIFSADLIQIDSEIMKVNTVGIGSTNFILVNRGWMGTGIVTHQPGIAVTVVDGAYNIVDNTINFYTAPRGPIPVGGSDKRPDQRDWTGITTHSRFQGRTFLRRSGGTDEPYRTNYVFDSIADKFDAKTKTFTLTSENKNVSGFSTNNGVVLINGVLQGPTGTLAIPQDYSLSEGSGISSITFTGAATSLSSDPNNASIPVGGIIVSVGSTGGLGYQPLISAGGTAVVSSAGTITSISIGNTGSGYRAGIQTVNVGVYTSSTGRTGIEFIGTAAVSNGRVVSVAITNPGSGYLIGSEPNVVFDAPLSYSNIPLIYSDSSASGFGTEATIDIVVGQGSSVIDFEIRNFGYGFGQKQILTVASGGLTGIPTDTNFTFEEFQITVDRTDSDKFSAWHFGELERLDNIHTEFDGVKRKFGLNKGGEPVTIRAREGSNIDVGATLLIFINDILQVPGESYTFEGGSVISFNEPPKGPNDQGFSGDISKILFYKGSGGVDVTFTEILETVKEGDLLTIRGDKDLVENSLNQDDRVVTEIVSSDTVKTNVYNGRGIDSNPDHERTVTWCKQTEDKIINGKIVSKARDLNAALINPKTNLIQSVGVGSTEIYVESVIPFFNPDDENQTAVKKQTIKIVSQNNLVAAAATAVVSIANTVESITIGYGGTGYTSAPSVIIETPVGLGTTARATATATLTGDAVSAITVSTPGVGYTRTSVPQVLIEAPKAIKETNRTSLYEGDFGDIVGLTSTSVGVASTGFVMDFFIPIDSYLRNTKVVGAAVTLSDISVGDYFTVKNSNVGSGVTSLYQPGGTLGVTTQFLDSVYEVAAVSVATTAVAGVGITYVKRVTVSVEDLGDITGIGLTEFYGEFSWGKITLGDRINATTFDAYTLRGTSGITTGGFVSRVEPLKLTGFSTT